MDSIGEQVRSFIMKTFPLARRVSLRNEDPLLEGGIIDSLGVLSLVSYLERTFHIQISDDDLLPENFQTIAHLVAFVGRRRADQTPSFDLGTVREAPPCR